jgi:hypothetical protein
MDLHAIERHLRHQDQDVFHQDHHHTVDLLSVQQGMSLQHQQDLQLLHQEEQQHHQQVDHSPAIRSKLEQVAYQVSVL